MNDLLAHIKFRFETPKTLQLLHIDSGNDD